MSDFKTNGDLPISDHLEPDEQGLLEVHGHELRVLANGNLWWIAPSGEGMELNKESLEKIFDENM